MLMFDCPMCGARYDVDDDLADTVVRCRECDELARVLAPPRRERPTHSKTTAVERPTQAAPSESSASRPVGSVVFHCQECNARYEVDPSLVGKTTRCRECDELHLVVAPKHVRKGVPAQPDPRPAPHASPQHKQDKSRLRPCSDCGREVSRRAAACPHCGCPLAVSTNDKLSPFDVVVSAFVQAVRELGYTIDSLDKQVGRIVFRSGLSWFSFGQEFTLVIIDNSDGTCSGDWTSKRSELIDWGEGRKIMNSVTRKALKKLKQEGLPDCFR